MLIQFAPFIVIFAIMYFLILRPQQRRAKEQRRWCRARGAATSSSPAAA